MSKTIGALFALFGMALAFLDAGHAQDAGNAFVGSWKEGERAADEVILIVTAVGAAGAIEGRMEFPGQPYVSTFGSAVDRDRRINRGVVDGRKLIIDTAPGARYELTLEEGELKGTFKRGAIVLPVSFRKR
jgi:hypothetical protein